MRATMFLSTLFAVSLLTGAALADKPVDKLRRHGDTVDKTYRQAKAAVPQPEQVAAPGTRVRSPLDRGASRMTCSDTGLDCPTYRPSSAHVARHDAAAPATSTRAPSAVDKLHGQDRIRPGDGDADGSMSSRAVTRTWSSRVTPGASRPGTVTGVQPTARQELRARGDMKASGERMSCNEAEECMMSSKGSTKIWSYRAVKAGTWAGPAAAKGATPAEVAVKAMRGQGGAATVHQQDNARKAEAEEEAARAATGRGK